MSILFHIMKEEHDRLIEAEKVYRKSVENAVQGSPRIKHIGKKNYLYIERRDGLKVIDEYVGPAESQKAVKILNAVKQRRKDQESLKKIRLDLKDVRKILRGKV